MSLNLNKLTAFAVTRTSKPGYYGDGGLWLQVARSGSKSWIFRFKMSGRQREMGLDSLHTRKRNAGGSGLGLAITRSIMRAHGGVASVRSTAGETVFELQLPAMLATCNYQRGVHTDQRTAN
jgi:hypothetical protein